MARGTRPSELRAPSLRKRLDANVLREAMGAKAPPSSGFIGRERARQALALGANIEQEGFNVFALGAPGSGRHHMILEFLTAEAQLKPAPSDWCYVHNFSEPKNPHSLQLPPGVAKHFARRMDEFVEELKSAIPAMFESREYKERRDKLEEEFKQREAQTLADLAKQAELNSVVIVNTPSGLMSAPAKNGKLMTPEDFAKLSQDDQLKRNQELEKVTKELKALFEKVSSWRTDHREKLKALNREFASTSTGFLLQTIKEKYQSHANLQTFLSKVEKNVVEHIADLQRSDNDGASFTRYKVNVIVTNDPKKGAPVLYEDNPSFANLIGKIEHQAVMGALMTDFSLLRPGALHQANGGFLLVDAQRILSQPAAWEALKRCLLSKKLTIEPLEHQMGTLSTVGLEPEPIPLALKVVLVGDRNLYYVLAAHDPDFGKLFKISADFDDVLCRDAKADQLYVHYLSEIIASHGLLPFSAQALAIVMEESMRLAGDVNKFSLHKRTIENILVEANHYAKEADAREVAHAHIDLAIQCALERRDRIKDIMHEEILNGRIQIAVGESRIGQINALSVMDLGGYLFGHPTRVTARVRYGQSGIVDIQRETKLGGPIHAKGVFILSSYIQGTFAVNESLSITASLVFEQTYGLVEGDSASVAELCAILSALAEEPIEQSFAVTGSVNQMGEVQAIGGVNEKIEGFFDICKMVGFNSKQGVIIPHSNIRNLMLREDVVEACEKGEFRVFAVHTINEAMEILTGVKATSLNDKIEKRLLKYAKKKK